MRLLGQHKHSLERVANTLALIFNGTALANLELPDEPPKVFNETVFIGLSVQIQVKNAHVYYDNTDIVGDVKGDGYWCGIKLTFNDDSKSNTAAIVGDTIGGIAGVAIVALGVFFFMKRYGRKAQYEAIEGDLRSSAA